MDIAGRKAVKAQQSYPSPYSRIRLAKRCARPLSGQLTYLDHSALIGQSPVRYRGGLDGYTNRPGFQSEAGCLQLRPPSLPWQSTIENSTWSQAALCLFFLRQCSRSCTLAATDIHPVARMRRLMCNSPHGSTCSLSLDRRNTALGCPSMDWCWFVVRSRVSSFVVVRLRHSAPDRKPSPKSPERLCAPKAEAPATSSSY